jgi:hypothetical protein
MIQVMPQTGWLVTGLSPWKTRFNPTPIYVGTVVDTVAEEQAFSEHFGFLQ